jgi:hypothetical protein
MIHCGIRSAHSIAVNDRDIIVYASREYTQTITAPTKLVNTQSKRVFL